MPATTVIPGIRSPGLLIPFCFSSMSSLQTFLEFVCSLTGFGVEVWQVRGCVSHALWSVKFRLGGAPPL